MLILENYLKKNKLEYKISLKKRNQKNRISLQKDSLDKEIKGIKWFL